MPCPDDLEGGPVADSAAPGLEFRSGICRLAARAAAARLGGRGVPEEVAREIGAADRLMRVERTLGLLVCLLLSAFVPVGLAILARAAGAGSPPSRAVGGIAALGCAMVLAKLLHSMVAERANRHLSESSVIVTLILASDDDRRGGSATTRASRSSGGGR